MKTAQQSYHLLVALVAMTMPALGCGESQFSATDTFDAVDVIADPGCVPACDGRQCGDDGCAATCGTCDDGKLCRDGVCIDSGCWPGDCPGGYMKFDGCRCRVATTGVSMCYPGTGTVGVSCDDMEPGAYGWGQDGNFGVNSFSLEAINGKEFLDVQTGLTWHLPGVEATCAEAADYCSGLNGTPDSPEWRVPTTIELLSIVDFSQPLSSSALSLVLDPVPDIGSVWTSDIYYDELNDVQLARTVNLSPESSLMGAGECPMSPEAGAVSETTVKRDVICVLDTEPAPTAVERFVDRGSTVLDRLTGLEWNKSLVLMTGDDWFEAIDACNSLDLDGHDWRVPDVKELASLLDFTEGGCDAWTPADSIPDFNICTMEMRIWSSTPDYSFGGAWNVTGTDGSIVLGGNYLGAGALCVSDE